MIPQIGLTFENGIPQTAYHDHSDILVTRDLASQPNSDPKDLLHLADLIAWAYNDLDAKTVSIIKEKLKDRGGESLITFRGRGYLRGWILESLVLLPLGCLLISAVPTLVVVEAGVCLLALEQALIYMMPALVSQFSVAAQVTYVLYVCCGLVALAAFVGAVSSLTILLFPHLRSPGAFCYFDTLQNKTIIFFRGSTPWWYNCTINALLGGRSAGFRHLGFLRAWKLMEDNIQEWLDRQDPARKQSLILTGHSLGGAIAQVAAHQLADKYAIEQVVSFGSAMIGGASFRDIYNSTIVTGHPDKGTLLSRTRHYTFESDSMPCLPVMLGYAHVGHRYVISSDGIIRRHDSIRDRLVSLGHLADPVLGAVYSGVYYLIICCNFRYHTIAKYRKALRRRVTLVTPRQ